MQTYQMIPQGTMVEMCAFSERCIWTSGNDKSFLNMYFIVCGNILQTQVVGTGGNRSEQIKCE
jgi:hypothetical protein